MSQFFSYVMIGLGSGAIYAMLGLGLVVVYRATGLLNFAQGEICMFTTFVVWTLHDQGWPLLLALFAGMVVGFGIGALVQRVIVQPVGDPHKNPLAVVIVTIGLFLGFNALAQLIWGTGTRTFDPLFGSGSVNLFSVSVRWQNLGALVVLGLEAVVFYLLFQKTRIGLAMRSVASNSESSALVGIPVNRILMLGWGLAGAIGAVAGTFAAPDRRLDTSLMQFVLIYGFAAITLGGFDSLVGAAVGGLIVGVVSSVVPRYVGFLSHMDFAPAFIVIFVVLLVRPQGLFGRNVVSRV